MMSAQREPDRPPDLPGMANARRRRFGLATGCCSAMICAIEFTLTRQPIARNSSTAWFLDDDAPSRPEAGA